VNSRLADDFTLSSATFLGGINFWYSAQFQTDLSSVTYAIYSNNAGALGALQYTRHPDAGDVLRFQPTTRFSRRSPCRI
jgi:hypothetical protein